MGNNSKTHAEKGLKCIEGAVVKTRAEKHRETITQHWSNGNIFSIVTVHIHFTLYIPFKNINLKREKSIKRVVCK